MLSLIAALLTAAAVGAGPAGAESSTGLYAPFPSSPGGDRAQRFVSELGVTEPKLDLKGGVTLGYEDSSPVPIRRTASRRAGLAEDDDNATGLLVGVALALVAAAATAAVVRHARR